MLTKCLAAPAVLAAASLIATPAAAAELEISGSSPVEAATHYGPWVTIGGGWGWGGGYRGHHHGHGSSAGDVLAGVLIIGTIAAVASAAARANRERSYPYPNRYPQPYPDRRGDYVPDARPEGPQGLEGAANLCLREVERDARAREVTRVERNAGGWMVAGTMADGTEFTCSIGADGRVERIDVGGRSQGLGDAASDTGVIGDRQDDDERYRSARPDVETDAEAGAQPTYPGGPLPGDESDAEAPGS